MACAQNLRGLPADDKSVGLVAATLKAGGVAVFPTDTVYGIAQSMLANPSGPRELFAIKHRPLSKVVPLLVGGLDDLAWFSAGAPPCAFRLAEAFWPGGLTLVVRASSQVPTAFQAMDGTVALRCPDEPFVRSLIAAVSSPLATTSANTSGMPAPASFAEVEDRILQAADISVDGGAAIVGISSTIVDCTGAEPCIVRRGAIPDGAIYTRLHM